MSARIQSVWAPMRTGMARASASSRNAIGSEWSGRRYGMNHSKDSIAGYLRDANGKTNGFYGTKKK